MVKDEEEITNQSNKTTFFIDCNAQLSNDNRPKALVKASSLSLITNATADTFDAKWIVEFEFAKFDNDQNDLIVAFIPSKNDKQQV